MHMQTEHDSPKAMQDNMHSHNYVFTYPMELTSSMQLLQEGTR